MSSGTTIISATWLLTMESDTVLLDHSVVVQGQLIIDVCPAENAIEKYPDAQHIELPNQLLMPGLINCHGHTAMNLFKGMADDLPLMTWLEEHIWPAEGKWVSPEFVKDGTKIGIAEMLLSGTTCYSDMYFFPEVAAETAAEFGMRAVCYGPVLDFPTPYGSGPDDYIEKILKAFDQFKHHSLVDIGFGPHAPYTVSDEPLTKIRTLADQLGISIQMHIHETAFEVDQALEQHNERPLSRLQKLNFLGNDVQAVHATALSDEDINLLKESGTHVIHCPESNLKLASGFCPVAKLQEQGINVALGTDGSASNNDLDMLGEMRTAALLAKAVSQNASSCSAFETLQMATTNAAKALGKEELIGRIVNGMQADMISVDFNRIASRPVYDPISHVVYCCTRDQVDHVWVAGDLKVKNKALTHMNEHQLIELAQSWANKIQASCNDQ